MGKQAGKNREKKDSRGSENPEKKKFMGEKITGESIDGKKHGTNSWGGGGEKGGRVFVKRFMGDSWLEKLSIFIFPPIIHFPCYFPLCH